MNNSELYVKLYARLETAIRQKYGYEDHPVYSASEKELAHYKEELTTIRNFRNVLTHSKPFGVEYCAEPHEKLIKTLLSLRVLKTFFMPLTNSIDASLRNIVPLSLLNGNCYVSIPNQGFGSTNG